jgi:hypothetical protein
VLLAQNQGVASARVPTALVSSTVKAATRVAAGRAATAAVFISGAAALTREVLKTMLLSRIKITTAALLALTLAGTGLWQARTRAEGETPPDAGFRVVVDEVLHDESTFVTRVGIDTPPGSKVELLSDKGKRISSSLSADVPHPKRPDGLSRIQVVIFADQVEVGGGSTNAVKFLLAYKVGSISSSTSEAGPMPANAKRLVDLMTVPIKSGVYKFGQETKLVTFKGVTYSLVVNRPK